MRIRGYAQAAVTAMGLVVLATGCGSPVAGRPASAVATPSRSAAVGAPGGTHPAAVRRTRTGAGGTRPAGRLPAPPAHTVIVVLENRSYRQVIGNPAAPYINALARRGALFTNSHAVTHPSEPNYLALFSGSTQGVSDDSCPHVFTAPNLGSELIGAHRGFAGYSEGLPEAGSRVCSAGEYARKHVPWVNFRNVPASASMPFSAFPAGHYARLPAVSFVIPDLCDDMHDCSVATGDAWLRGHLGGYAAWALTHHSLLVVTWDENDGAPGNRIPTIFAGQSVRPGRYGMPVTHYGVLRTIEALYHLRPTARAATAAVITSIWR